MSAQALNRNPEGLLGCLSQSVEARWGLWGSADWQLQVCENLDDHRGILDGRENGQGAVALGADDEIDGKDAFEQLRPNSCGPGKEYGANLLLFVTEGGSLQDAF